MSDKYKAVVGPLLIGASLLTGNAVLITVAGGIGVNWTSDGLAALWAQTSHTLSRSSQLKKVYEEAIRRGVHRLKVDYELQTGGKVPAAFAIVESCAKAVAQTEFPHTPLYLSQVQHQLARSLKELLYGHDAGATEYIQIHLLTVVAQEFRTALASDDKAWRFYYSWLFEVASYTSVKESYQLEQINAVLVQLRDSSAVLQVLQSLSEQNSLRYERIEALTSRVEKTTDRIELELRGMSSQLNGESLSHKVLSFTELIAAKTSDFIGRDFVFESVEKFMGEYQSGYFIINGEPGIGKTSLLAELIRRRQCIHHFNIAPQNIRSPKQFLSNVCAQLMLVYDLEPNLLPQHATENSNFLVQLLKQATLKNSGKPVVVAIDALDESDYLALPAHVNALYLPEQLPSRVYFIVSSRPVGDTRLSVKSSKQLYLDAQSPENERDIKEYIARFARRPSMQESLRQWGVLTEALVEELWSKSEGNFMYLHYVLPAIESGQLANGRLDELPEGLIGYYSRHWRQMREAFGPQFNETYVPLVCILAVAGESVTIEQIAAWSHLPKVRVVEAVERWKEFLVFDKDQSGGSRGYRIYHASFQDFLKSQVDLASYEDLLANYYLSLAGIEL